MYCSISAAVLLRVDAAQAGVQNIIRYKRARTIIINYKHRHMQQQALHNTHRLPTCDSCSDTSTETDQHQPHNGQHTHLTHLVLADLAKSVPAKAKSSLCRNFTQKGCCPYDKKCQFAHGPEQLRINRESNRSYKTKGCHAFSLKGYCVYGQRCNFIHQSVGELSGQQKWSAIYLNNRQIVKSGQNRQQSRLLQLLGI